MNYSKGDILIEKKECHGSIWIIELLEYDKIWKTKLITSIGEPYRESYHDYSIKFLNNIYRPLTDEDKIKLL